MAWGLFIRAALTALAVPLVISLLWRILDPLIGQMNHPDSMLVNGFTAIGENAVTIGLLSVLVMLVAGALVESRVSR